MVDITQSMFHLRKALMTIVSVLFICTVHPLKIVTCQRGSGSIFSTIKIFSIIKQALDPSVKCPLSFLVLFRIWCISISFVLYLSAYMHIFKPVIQSVIDFFRPSAIVLQVCYFDVYIYQLFYLAQVSRPNISAESCHICNAY